MNKPLMDQKLLSQGELQNSVKKMIMESLVLSEDSDLQGELLKSLPNLDEKGLKSLLSLLQDEETDWKTYFEHIKAQKEEMMTKAKNESLGLRKEAEKLIHGADEALTQEEDQSKAEDLLHQL